MMETVQHNPSSPPPQHYNTANSNGTHKKEAEKSDTTEQHPHSPNTNNNAHDDKSSMTAAADLIRTLDCAFSEMSSLSASAARDAEDARRNAREASEVARRYTARSYAGGGFEQALLSPKQSTLNQHEYEKDVSLPLMNEHDSDKNDTAVEPTVNGTRDATTFMDESPLTADATTTLVHHQQHSRKRKNQVDVNKVQSSSERLARSHAEDVLSLSLELERTKQALQQEQYQHDETRASLTQARAQQTQASHQIQKLQDSIQVLKQEHGREMDGLQQELSRAQVRVEAAEEDAQLALDLAKGNAESREQLESWLQRALQEVEVLRSQLERSYTSGVLLPTSSSSLSPSNHNTAPQDGGEPTKRKPVVRFADSPTIVETPSSDGNVDFTPRQQGQAAAGGASRAMVAAGRHILQRATTPTTTDHERLYAVSPPQKSRREELRQRLRALDKSSSSSSDGLDTPARSSVEFGSKAQNGSNVTRLLRESGQRLGLSWDAATASSQWRGDDTALVESVTRQFCHTVEVRTRVGCLFLRGVCLERTTHVLRFVCIVIVLVESKEAKRRYSGAAGFM